MVKKGIAVIDYGSQYTQLIARRIRDLGVYSWIQHCDVPVDEIMKQEPLGIVLSGGPSSVYDEGAPQLNKDYLKTGLPVLGICYGMQLLAESLLGKVQGSVKREYGYCKVRKKKDSALFAHVPDEFTVWMSHGDIVVQVANGYEIIAESENCPIAGFEQLMNNIYALQFHPEVVHTEYGKQILSNFIFDICGCRQNWRMDEYVNELINGIKKETRDAGVLAGISGGIDSTVLARVLFEALGARFIGVFIDNGLLRKNEVEIVQRRFENLGIPLEIVDAGKLFLERLKDISEPERKRRIIGDTFVEVFKQHAQGRDEVKYFAQGTLYPDVVESGASIGPSSVIKTHHNLVDEVRQMGYTVMEPFRELFKDEVRTIGRILGMPEEVITQHPFPGPGLAVRIIGAVEPEKLAWLRDADEIIIEEVKAAGLYEGLWQCFPVLLPVKTVGVMGDQRSYRHVIAIRAIKSIDGMTADWAPLPYEVLNRISSRIVNEIKEINRVVYDITNKPPATIEWE